MSHNLPSQKKLQEYYRSLTPQSQQELDDLLSLFNRAWLPNPGPQSAAYHSAADVLGYGGQAGGGKTDLTLGLAYMQHHRSVIFRREHPRLTAIIDRSRQIFNPFNDAALKDMFNESLHRWRFGGTTGHLLRFGSIQYEQNILNWQGQPYDLHAFDEVTEFSENIFRSVTAWNRTTRAGQRCRVVCTMNPPLTKEGEWVIKFWGPWLDDKHPRPAKAGELRWYTTIGGQDIEVDGPTPIKVAGEEALVVPKSRTFIFASVYDNPYLLEQGYVSTLQALPEPLRSKLLHGDFKAGIMEDPWQIIPADWVRAAQARWTKIVAEGVQPKLPVQQLGVDVARGGPDQTVLTPRRGNFFDKQLVYHGTQTPDGPSVVRVIVPVVEKDTLVAVDIIGVGGSPFDFSKAVGLNIVALNGAEATEAKDKSGKLGFFNRRAEWHWQLRENLDPSSGQELALPADPELLADLTAARWEITPRGIKVELKKEIVARLGRSPDKGESLIYANAKLTFKGQGIFEYYQQQHAAAQAAREAAAAVAQGGKK
jgi:hypothetical protein